MIAIWARTYGISHSKVNYHLFTAENTYDVPL